MRSDSLKRSSDDHSSQSSHKASKKSVNQAGLAGGRGAVDNRLAAEPPTDSTMHTHLGSRLSSRIITRSKARAADGFSSDSELLSAIHQQPTADPTTACKSDLTRKPAPLVPGQAALPAVVASTRLAAANGVTAGPPAVAAAVATAGAASKPRHQRSHSAGHAPKGSLHLQVDAASDIASLADTLVKAAAGQQLGAAGARVTEDTGAGLTRRSTRLAAAAAAASATSKSSSHATDTSGVAASLGRSSAPVPQHKRASDGSMAIGAGALSKKAPTATAAVAGAAAATAAAATAAAAMSAAVRPTTADTPSPARPAGASELTDSAALRSRTPRRVRFAAGPLDPEQHPNSTHDGHPASEGALAVPVRRVPVCYGMDLSRGNVLMLEQLLGSECSMSVMRLKRRVGLLPPIRPARPHASPIGAVSPPAPVHQSPPGAATLTRSGR